MNLNYLNQYAKYMIKNIIQNNYLNNSNIRNYQLSKINDILKNAKENSEFYKKFYKKNYIKLKTLQDIKQLPILKKELFKNSIRENTILSSKFNKQDLNCGHTTGSTGTPLEICFDKKSLKLKSQVQRRLWKNMGILPYKRFVKIWRDKNLNPQEEKLRDSGLLLSIAVGDINDPLNSAITNEKILDIIEELQNFKPQVIRGYVSSLYSIAQIVEKLNIEFYTLESVTTSAEYLPSGMWNYFEKVFKCPVYNLYGGTEAPSIALNNKNTQNLTISEDLYYIEVLNENGNDVKAGEQGLITITDLHSSAIPFIRYQIGDMAIVDDSFYILSDEFRYFKSVEGRTNDIFELSDGSLIYSHLWHIYFRDEYWIDRFQVIQKKKNLIEIKLLLFESNNKKYKSLKKKIENAFKIVKFQWTFINKIELQKGNKYRAIISMVENKFNMINKD